MTDAPPPRPQAAPRSFATARAIFALMMREMSTTYGRSPGGYLWTIIEPIAGLAVMSVVFSFAFRSPPLGSNFPLFFASGMMPLAIYMGLSSKIGMAIPFSRPLLAYPAVTYMDAILARLILDVITQIVVTAIIIGGIIVIFGLNLSLDYAHIALALSMAVALGVGVGLLNGFLMAIFPIWQTVWAVLNRPMFIISGVLFLPDVLSAPYRDILYLNPVTHIIAEMRQGVFASYEAVYADPAYVFAIALVPALLGLLLLYRRHNDILEL